MDNTTLQISRILVTGPKLRRPRRSVHLVGVVVDTMVDVAVDATVDAVVDTKVNARSVTTIRRMGVEIIM